jgi:hypothetical protein
VGPFFERISYGVKTAKGRVGFIEPMLAVAVAKRPEGAARSCELEFDASACSG